MENTAPTICPITGLVYFMTLEDENGKFVHTYGGPFDSYTIPEKDDDGEIYEKTILPR